MKMSFKTLLCGSVVMLAVSVSSAQAQINQQTGIADPGQVQDRLRDQLTIPQVTPDVEIRELELQGAPDGAENVTLTLGGFRVEGASVYSEEELQSFYADKIGQTITLADVYAIANAITLKYRNDGYALTQVVVPPQTIDSGIVDIRIVEGFIDGVTIQAPEDETSAALDLIRDYASMIAKGGAVNVADLERGLLLINDLPGVSARSILSASETTPGAADLLIIVDRDKYEGVVTADNYGSRFLGPVQVGSAHTYRSLLGVNDSISLQLAAAPQDWFELAFASLSYEMPIGSLGTTISALASKSVTDPGYTLQQFDVKGYSDLYSVKVEHPFIRSRNTNLNAHLQFDWRDVKSSNNLQPAREDRIRALRFGAEYDFLDRVFGVAANTLELEVSQGLNILNASEEGRAELTRASADPQFTKLEGRAQRLQRITDHVNLLVTAGGQWSSAPLLSSEEYTIGGFSSVRGFDPAEVGGDDGVSGSLELQWTNPGDLQGGYVDRYQLYSFFDAGTVWDQDATASNLRRQTLTGAGLGARVSFTGDFDAGLGIAFPLNRDVATQNDDDPKVYFNLSKSF